MRKRMEFLGIKQSNKRNRRMLAIVLLVIVGIGFYAAKLWANSECASWLTSTEGTKVACIGAVGNDAERAAESAKPDK